jgi:hypothetical protein
MEVEARIALGILCYGKVRKCTVSLRIIFIGIEIYITEL